MKHWHDAAKAMILAVVACAACAAPAVASTLMYAGEVTSSDPPIPGIGYDQNGPTGCGVAPTSTGRPTPGARFDAYAFRNTGASAACVTIEHGSTNGICDNFSYSYTSSGLLGSDAFACDPPNPASYSFDVAPGQTFATILIAGVGPLSSPAPYSLRVTGRDIVPARLVQATEQLGNGNIMTMHASSLEDGTAVDGVLSDEDVHGRSYSGPVRCLRVSGRDASLVMTFSQSTGLPSTERGAVYWIHQGNDFADPDGVRNSVLTQGQLDKRFSTCPDPDAPPTGRFRAIANFSNLVISDPAQVTPTG